MNKDLWDKFMNKQYTDVLAEVGRYLRENDSLFYMHVAGLSLIALGNMDKGMDWTCASLALTDASVDWFSNGATACMEQEQYIHAILFLTNGLKEYPNDLKMTYMQGLCHVHIHEWGMAIDFFNRTLEIDPAFYHAKLGIGFCFHMLGMYDDAIKQYESIHDGTAEDMEAVYNNHACVLMELNRQQEALQFLLDKCPGTERPGTLFNMSFLYLGLGEWPLGWQLYRYRETVSVSKSKIYAGHQPPGVPKVEQPIARSLHEIHGKHLLLFHEQGFGDTMMFVRYAQQLEEIADHLTIGVPKPLERLIRGMKLTKPFEVITTEAEISCDIALPMLDAPILFETTRDTIPNPGSYFKVSSAARAVHYLPNLIGGRLRVGLCWAGATRIDNIRAHSIDRRRSIPFEVLEPLLDLGAPRKKGYNGIDFYSLQLSDHHKDHHYLNRVLEDDFDMMDTAAIVNQLDLVITIDSAVAHLAGAMGLPVWLLSRFDGCWRWGWNDETTSPWYPTMRIFRQPAHNSWPDVIFEVRNALVKHLSNVR